MTALACLGKRGGYTRCASGGDANTLFRKVDHAGADTDFHTSLALLPDQGLGVVALANVLPAPVSELGQAVLDRLAEASGLPVPPVLVTLNDILRDQGVEVALVEVVPRSQRSSIPAPSPTMRSSSSP